MKGALPIWYHLGAKKRLRLLNNTRVSDFLRDRHGVSYVADLLKLTRRTCFRRARAQSNDFVPSTCECRACGEDTARGCKHPLGCCKAAANLLEQVRPKWHPDVEPVPDGLTLTSKCLDANTEALESEGVVTFNPSLTERGSIMEAMRVFVDPSVHDEPPAIRARAGRIVEDEAVTAYLVGPSSRKSLPKGAEPMPNNMGLVYYPGSPEKSAIVRPRPPRGNILMQQGEVTAALHAVEDTPKDSPLRLV
ncbi:uncharacterized protein C8Q71DRAFT_718783, partial [Rhodofomes roseus]